MRRPSTLLVYICAQHECPGRIGLPALVVPVEKPASFEPVEGLAEGPAGHLRPDLQRSPRHLDPQPVGVDLAAPGRGLYELQGDVPVAVAAAALPLLGPPAAPRHPARPLSTCNPSRRRRRPPGPRA